MSRKISNAPEDLRRWYLTAEHGLTDAEVADEYGVARSTANRWRKDLGAVELVRGRYTIYPTQEDVEMAQQVLQRGRKPTARSEG